MGTTGNYYRKSAGNSPPDRRATVIFDTWGGPRSTFSVISARHYLWIADDAGAFIISY
jgi:hypothetical protein